MPTFTIDTHNRLAVHDAEVTVADDTVKFASATELADVTKDWPTPRLIEVWNKLPNVTPITKFTDRKTAIRRIWTAFENIEPSGDRESPVKTKAAPQQKSAGKTKAVAKAKPAAKPKSATAQTKTDQVIAALREPAGVTLKQLVAITGWQPHSVRGFLSAHVSKRMGLRVKSLKRDGERFYRVLS
jgi:hypothetical protein